MVRFKAMSILIFLIIFGGTLSVINWFSLDSAISFSFIGRFSLVLILVATSGLHLSNALSMNDMTENVSESTRNLVYFTGVLELIFAVGLTFVPSLKWTSIVFIGFLLLLIILNLVGVFRDFSFAEFGKPRGYPLNILEYISIGIWVLLFGVIYRDKQGILGLKGKGW